VGLFIKGGRIIRAKAINLKSEQRRKLLPLAIKIRKLISIRDKIKNIETKAQWKIDRLREIEKKIWTLQNKKDDLVSDLHDRLAFRLVQDNDLIFLPTFETKKMSAKKGTKNK